MILETYLQRSMDPARFNEIANHPEVRPWIGGGEGPIDLTAHVENYANICLLGEHSAFVCHKLGIGRYEVHSMVLPEGRGEQTIYAVREGLRFMFCATDCTEILTRVPDNNKAAHALANAVGFQEAFRREKCWRAGDEQIGVSYRIITMDRWRSMDAACVSWGEWFHDKLEKAKADSGSPLPVHEEDEAHNRAVGASVLMTLNGNPRKAVGSYNQWAIFAGYAPIVLLSETPVLIDVVDAIVALSGDDMEVLKCRLEAPSPQ